MSALVACSLALFGGAYLWAAVPVMLGCGAIAAAWGVRIGRSVDAWPLDRALIALLACISIQLVPLPHAVLSILAPQTDSFYSALWLGYELGASTFTVHPLSVEPAGTLHAIGVTAAAVLLFWACRALLSAGGTRRLIRAISFIGLALSLLAIVQRATSPNRIYWFWQPATLNAEPIGPFVNRNHFATWILLALPLCLGYLMARLQVDGETRRRPTWIMRLIAWMNTQEIWFGVAACLMILSLLASRSRSGMISFAAALAVSAVMARQHLPREKARWILGFGLALFGAVLIWSDLGGLMERINHTLYSNTPGRLLVWRETLPVIRDFWLTGTGAGTYQTAMLVYQQSLRTVAYFNHAHNHYLQVAAEGGLLLSIPVALALISLVSLIRRRLAEDDPTTYWLRMGATTSLVAVAVQCIWETGLRMPANAVLFAVVAALATAQRKQASGYGLQAAGPPAPGPPAALDRSP